MALLQSYHVTGFNIDKALGPGTLSPADVHTPTLIISGLLADMTKLRRDQTKYQDNSPFKALPVPVIVPEVPIPAQKMLISGFCLRI